MLDKADRRYLRASDPTALVGSIQGAVYQQGVQLQQTGPNTWMGRGTQASYGIVPKVAVTIMPIQDGLCVDVRVSPDFESNGIIILVVAWIFFFPVAIILAILGYQDWERRAVWVMGSIWNPLAPQMMNPPAQAWGPQMPLPPTVPGNPGGHPGGPQGWGPPR